MQWSRACTSCRTTPPWLVGKKLLRVNLSDVAAMGATPFGYLMTVLGPEADAGCLGSAAFAAGLGEDQERFGVRLLGGDTTSTPGPLTLSLTILATVTPGGAICRVGARPGHGVWVTGTIGDAALGLAALQGRLDDPTGHLATRYRLPEPRLGLRLAGIAAAGMDVSDGLVQDLGRSLPRRKRRSRGRRRHGTAFRRCACRRTRLARRLPHRWG